MTVETSKFAATARNILEKAMISQLDLYVVKPSLVGHEGRGVGL